MLICAHACLCSPLSVVVACAQAVIMSACSPTCQVEAHKVGSLTVELWLPLHHGYSGNQGSDNAMALGVFDFLHPSHSPAQFTST